MCPVFTALWDHGTGCLPSTDLGENTLKEEVTTTNMQKTRLPSFIYFKRTFPGASGSHKLVLLKKKKKIKHLLSSAAFNENHLRQKRRQEITIQDRLLRGEFVWQSTSPPPRGWAPPDSKSLSSSSGVEALAQRAELKEALGVEEPEDVISQEVGEVRNPPSAARACNPRASYPQPYTASLGS